MTDVWQKGCCKMICFTAALFAFSKPIRFAGYEPAEKVSAFFIGKMFCQDLLHSDLRFNTALKIKYLMLWLCIELRTSIVLAFDKKKNDEMQPSFLYARFLLIGLAA